MDSAENASNVFYLDSEIIYIIYIRIQVNE